MKLAICSFTGAGAALADQLADRLVQDGHNAVHTPLGGAGKASSLGDWTAHSFARADGLIFVGATGIAVRAVAPHLRSKATDPAVVAVDDTARYCIPLVSGHIGGANRLAKQLAGYTGATAVITTATDLRGLFAVDAWAVEQGLHIQNPGQIKRVSAKLLGGEGVCIHSDFPIQGAPPEGVRVAGCGHADIVVSVTPPPSPALWLVPPAVTAGIGCRKGAGRAVIARVFRDVLERNHIAIASVRQVCSIDLKAGEPGLLAYCEELGVPLRTFSAHRLGRVAGEFTRSPFVEEVTGVDNVCERAAVLGSGGSILVPKTAESGVTVALALGTHTLSFDRITQISEEFPQ